MIFDIVLVGLHLGFQLTRISDYIFDDTVISNMESVYRYVYSCEIDADLKIRVCSLTGTLPRNYSVSPAVIGNNFYVTLSVSIFAIKLYIFAGLN